MRCTAYTKIAGIISSYALIGISSILTSDYMDTKVGILLCGVCVGRKNVNEMPIVRAKNKLPRMAM
jgi:hypothetical protein